MIALATLLALAAAKDFGANCESFVPNSSATGETHGAGLWISGIAFVQTDIASAILQPEARSGTPTVLITFTATGRAKFFEAQRCRKDQLVEFWLDDERIALVRLQEYIKGPQVLLFGAFDRAKGEMIAGRLQPPAP